MDYSEHNSIVWLISIVYALTALFILPDSIGDRHLLKLAKEHNEGAIGFALRFLNIVLIFPMISLENNISICPDRIYLSQI